MKGGGGRVESLRGREMDLGGQESNELLGGGAVLRGGAHVHGRRPGGEQGGWAGRSKR